MLINVGELEYGKFTLDKTSDIVETKNDLVIGGELEYGKFTLGKMSDIVEKASFLKM